MIYPFLRFWANDREARPEMQEKWQTVRGCPPFSKANKGNLNCQLWYLLARGGHLALVPAGY